MEFEIETKEKGLELKKETRMNEGTGWGLGDGGREGPRSSGEQSGAGAATAVETRPRGRVSPAQGGTECRAQGLHPWSTISARFTNIPNPSSGKEVRT